jgi:arylsulfatase A-like enzyme
MTLRALAPGARPAPEPTLVRAAWLALVLALARGTVLVALELAHHGDGALARLRLAHVVPTLALVAAGLALAGYLGSWGLALVPRARVVGVLAFAALFGAFLAGLFDADASRRIGLATTTGQLAMACAGAVGLALALVFVLAWPRAVAARFAGGPPWAALPALVLAAAVVLARSALGGLGERMELRQVEREVATLTFEVVRAHPEAAPAPGLIAPATAPGQDGAARPGLVLAPPALVRRALAPEDEGAWLVGGAGVDHSAAEIAARLPGHVVRCSARLDGAEVFAAELALADAGAWRELGDGRGVPVGAAGLLELATELLDAERRAVVPAEPLRVGFGGLALERRSRIARTRASPEHPSVVLVLIDTLRADRTSAYGYARETTPHLAALARRGVLFEEAHSTSSWTWPSTASILTGLLPEEHGVEDAASAFLAQGLDTLPEALQRLGVTTAAWSGSPLIVPDKAFDQGFEFFDASREGHMRRSELFLPGALEWLESAAGWRFFLYLHLMEPHAPYVPLAEGRARFAADVPVDLDPRRSLDQQWELLRRYGEDGVLAPERVVPPEEQRWISDLYDACVWSADHYLGLVLARLEELGLAESTLVAVTSDHGEELFDHGLLAHAHALHRELVHVPLVLAGPGLARGERVRAPRSGAALGPTLARLAGTELAGPGGTLDLFADDARGALFFSTRQGYWNGAGRQPLFGLRQGDAVLHFAPEGAPFGRYAGPEAPPEGELRLYDLARDPRELRDLAAEDPARAQALLALLRAQLAGREARSLGSAAADPATLESLRRLGYVGPGEGEPEELESEPR